MAKRQKATPGEPDPKDPKSEGKKTPKPKKKSPRKKTRASTPSKPKKVGRPTKFTPELADLICERLHTPKARGIFDVIKDTDIDIHEATLYRWLNADREFREKYASARKLQADRLAWASKAIADLVLTQSADLDYIIRMAGDAVGSALHAAVAKARLQIDTYKWMAGKLDPVKYGKKADEKVEPESTAKTIDEAEKLIDTMTDEEAAKVLQEAVAVGE